MQEVGGSIPPGSTSFTRSFVDVQQLSPSSRGLGHHPFTVRTGVRIPVGTPLSMSAEVVLELPILRRTPPSRLAAAASHEPQTQAHLVTLPRLENGQRGPVRRLISSQILLTGCGYPHLIKRDLGRFEPERVCEATHAAFARLFTRFAAAAEGIA
jgi:hypothetical protein